MLLDSTPPGEFGNYRVTGTLQVTSASPFLDGLFVVASADNVNYRGLLMRLPDGMRMEEGDIADVEGVVEGVGGNPVLVVEKVSNRRSGSLPPAKTPKPVDFRRGRLHARRVMFIGEIDPVSVKVEPDGSSTAFRLMLFNFRFPCRVPGRLKLRRYEGAPVQVTGVGFNRNDPEDGQFKESVLFIRSLDDVVSLREDTWKTPLLVASCIVTGITLIVLWALWIKTRREKLKASAIAAERRRMAVELHDTVEQHFAAANLLIAGALRAKGLPEGAAALMRQAAATMSSAKLHVRDAVMDLRGADEEKKPLDKVLENFATRMTGSCAVRVRRRMFGEPREIGTAVQCDVMAIVREATTNAIKHGHAKNIAILSDWNDGTCRLRVLNDGEKFDPSLALGPESGHFGLSGMQERAKRCGIVFSFVSTGRWCGFELSIQSDRKGKRL